MKKLDKLDKFELIDIVHKAKCGKLQGLDTKDMTKEQLVTHLYNSKCPEVHEMITEITELKDDLNVFVDKYLELGKDLKVEQVYYSGLQDAIISIFFYEAWKNKRYDCILENSTQQNYSKFSFDFSVTRPPEELTRVIKYIGNKIDICRMHKEVKVVAIPIHFISENSGHANAIIYRVDSNTFERFEPHGSSTGSNYLTPQYKKILDLRNKLALQNNANIKKYNTLTNKEKLEEGNKKLREKITEMQVKISKLDAKREKHHNNINKPLNDLIEKYFTKILPRVNKNFKGAKYISPDIVTEAIKGLQTIEPEHIQNKYMMTDEEYKARIGGFCVMWSVMYFDLVFRFPKATPAVLNKSLLELLQKKGEFAFGELALGYLQDFKKHIDRFLGQTDYSDKAKRKNLIKDLEKFVTID